MDTNRRMKKRICFLGAGSWGTALAILCANNGHRVVLWSATNKFRKKREHVDCLPGTRLPDSVKIADDVEEACKDKDIIVVSVASPYMRSTARLMKPFVKPGQIVVNVAKGIEDKTLMTRGIAEISRLGMEMGGKMESFFGLSGIGDLIVTCTSTHSRNHNCGYLLGKGKTLEEAKKEIRQEIEGVNCARAAMALANKHHVNMPIVEQINAVLFEGKSTDEALEELILRERAIEYQSLKW